MKLKHIKSAANKLHDILTKSSLSNDDGDIGDLAWWDEEGRQVVQAHRMGNMPDDYPHRQATEGEEIMMECLNRLNKLQFDIELAEEREELFKLNPVARVLHEDRKRLS